MRLPAIHRPTEPIWNVFMRKHHFYFSIKILYLCVFFRLLLFPFLVLRVAISRRMVTGVFFCFFVFYGFVFVLVLKKLTHWFSG